LPQQRNQRVIAVGTRPKAVKAQDLAFIAGKGMGDVLGWVGGRRRARTAHATKPVEKTANHVQRGIYPGGREESRP
jgi:hypothetical protein